jgi:hypothetical protein
MAYLDPLVFQNGNLTISGYSKDGAIVPSSGIETCIMFKVENITNTETLLPINKINFPVKLSSALFKYVNNGDLIINIYATILDTIPTTTINILADMYVFPYLVITPTNKVTLKAKTGIINKCTIFSTPINVFEVSDG